MNECAHDDCGVQCDVVMVLRRPNGEVTDLVSTARIAGLDTGRPTAAAPVKRLLKHLTLRQAAGALGVSVTTVLAQLTTENVSDPSPYLRAEELLRAQAPFTEVALAAEVGLPASAVRMLCDALGLCLPGRASRRAGGTWRYSAAQLAEARRLRASGMPLRAVAAETGVHYSTVSRLAAAA